MMSLMSEFYVTFLFLATASDLQKHSHLQMAFTYDVINVFLRRTINEMVSKIL